MEYELIFIRARVRPCHGHLKMQKAATYIMRQIAEGCSSVMPKSGTVIKKFGTTKEPLIERRNRPLLHPSGTFSRYTLLDRINKFISRAICHLRIEKKTSITLLLIMYK